MRRYTESNVIHFIMENIKRKIIISDKKNNDLFISHLPTARVFFFELFRRTTVLQYSTTSLSLSPPNLLKHPQSQPRRFPKRTACLTPVFPTQRRAARNFLRAPAESFVFAEPATCAEILTRATATFA